MDTEKFNNEDVIKLLNNIDRKIYSVDNYETKILKRIQEIKSINSKLSNKTFFDLNDSIVNLKFQNEILNNEKKYIVSLKKTFLEKIYNDLYNLAESVLMFVSSIDNIEFNDKNSKVNIIKKITSLKAIPYNKLNVKNLFSIVNSISNNLQLIKSVIDSFMDFIKNTNKIINEQNYHCRTFETNLNNQKSHMIIEYNKYVHQLYKILNYYNEFSDKINEQLSNQKIVEFCNKKNNQSNKSIKKLVKSEDSDNNENNK